MARRYRLRHEGEEVEIGDQLLVGRDAECQLVLENSLVSRRHARLFTTEDGLVIEDLGSRNGVFVNDRRIAEPTLLAHGDMLGCGLERCEVVDASMPTRRQKVTQPMPPFSQRDVEGPEAVTVTAQLDMLSEREREVFELIVFGHTQREIAQRLHISVKTIETHRARIADKLHCRTRAELVAYAVTAGVFRKATG